MTDQPEFKDVIPTFRIFSIEKAKEFYVEFLGFTVDWEHRYVDNFPLYMQVSRAGLRLHLTEHYGDATPGSAVFIWMRGIVAFQAELAGKDYRYAKPGLNDAPWDAKTFMLTDPFGNKLTFNEPLKADDPRA